MKTNQLINLFNALKGNKKAIRFGDLMKKGFTSPIIFNAIELSGATTRNDSQGYTIITF